MANPFDNDEGTFVVVVNGARQHSLWPADHPVPAGWSPVTAAGSRRESLDYIEQNWTDLRPAHLIA
ncbi:MbtH family protein [Streptomyces boninensis]|uniref:MbtH family protein n=1 Tax=Streptomyces boninensis TaxID=2039455 RepID=UPI003B20FC4C